MDKKDEEIPEENDSTAAEKGQNSTSDAKGHDKENVVLLKGMYENWFLDYASYVILERAVPGLSDGLKPVQRRILHSMKELDDGRYNKIANIIGNTMKYHPHGDASIGDALVQIGQKDLLIDMQGNWGNILTGDNAAAPRYIEGRLTKFANEVVFNPKTTKWGRSYDGRNKEPENLPVKFPLLLAQGGEGIAVGLACKMLPHNFNELIQASIDSLRGKKSNIMPDFPTAGMADTSQYNEGLRGGRIRVRARITQLDKKTLVITEIPFGTTTSNLIDSIVKANDKGKIKLKKVEDNTAENVEIVIHLPPNISPDKTIDALYAFTDCELSISPNACVISEDRPMFLSVNELLKRSTEQTKDLLRQELEIKLDELESQWHSASLEKIFIENRVYRDIEDEETWEGVIEAIDTGIHKFVSTPARKNAKKTVLKLKRDINEEDIVSLTEIKIKRISKFDSDKAASFIKSLEGSIKEVKNNLANLTEFAIDYFKELKKKYGQGRERKTEIKVFDSIVANKVIITNKKLYVNRQEGFVGHGLRKDEYVCDCSDIDDIIVFLEDGTMVVSKISEKKFMGKDIIHVGVWKKDDKRTIYHAIYQDGTKGNSYMKRFGVTSITRDKQYPITRGTKGSKILYFSVNPNGESEIVQVLLRPRPNLRKAKFEIDFAELAIKGRGAAGNIVSKYLISKIVLKEKGISTLGARKIWYDDVVQRLNAEGRGEFLGEFSGEDRILTVMQSGEYRLSNFDLSTRFDEDMILIEKWNPDKPVSAIYLDGEKGIYFVKRFMVELTDKKMAFISETEGSSLELATTFLWPRINIQFDKRSNDRPDEEVQLDEFIGTKGVKAQGNRLTRYKVKSIDHIPITEEQQEKEDSALSVLRQAARAGESESSEEDEVNEEEEVEQDEVGEEEDEFEEADEEEEEEAPAAKPTGKKKSGKAIKKDDKKDQMKLF